MPKRKKNKGADYEYVGTARKTTSPDTEYASENAMNPQTRRIAEAAKKGGSSSSECGSESSTNPQTKKIEQQAKQGSNQNTEFASEVDPSPGKRDEARAKPKGHC